MLCEKLKYWNYWSRHESIKTCRRFSENLKGQINWVALNYKLKFIDYKKNNISFGTTNYRDKLNSRSVDAVIITSQPSSYFQMTKYVIVSGKHLLVKKPLAIKADELNKTVSPCGSYPDVIVCGCSCIQSRLQPKFNYIKKIIGSGDPGGYTFIHDNSVSMHAHQGI